MRLSQFARRAFTLVELLTVIAITAVLMTLVILPIVQGFNLTRSAQAFADAQDKARQVIERVTREVGNSARVLDNAGNKGRLAILVPGRNGAVIAPILLDYMKLDIVKPAEGDPARGLSGAYINPNINKEDPTRKAAKGQMVLPVTPGDTVARWAVGLRNPLDPRGYNNPYDGLLMPRNGQRDNLYVLMRFEVQPYTWDNVNDRYVVNQKYFDVDPDTVVPGDPFSGKPVMDDPYFLLPGFDRFGTPLAGAALAAKQLRVQNWLSAGIVVTEVSRYDMIAPLYDKQSRGVVYDGNVPRLLSLVEFRPAGIGNEPMEGMAAARLTVGETDNPDLLAPDVFRGRKGGWSNLLVRVWPTGWDRLNPNANDYLIARHFLVAGADHMGIFLFDPDVDVNEATDGILLFDITVYDWAVGNNLSYPFSRSLNPVAMANGYNRDRLMAFDIQATLGKIITSFEVYEVGDPNQPVPPIGNYPSVNTGPTLSPIQDPAPPGTQFDPIYSPSNIAYEINRSFNKTWQTHPALRGSIHRFIDLRVVAQPDGTPSPLDPNNLRGYSRAKIVPGSEVVIGPDQNPGPNYGAAIRYARTTREPGPNQYKINYTDQVEPTDYSLLGFTPAEVSSFLALGGAYSAGDFISAFFQPRFKSGYVQLYSDPNLPLPLGNIRVRYRFQLSRVGDTVAADYDSRQLISIKLTIRNYPQSSQPNPQGITVAGTAAARNILR